MELLVEVFTSYFEFLKKYEFDGEDDTDIILRHFRSVNLSGEYSIERLPVTTIYTNDRAVPIRGYALSYTGNNPDKGITVSQLHNMNLTSGYRAIVDSDGTYSISVFFLNKCINLVKESSYEADSIRKMLINLKLVSTHVIRELYPSFDERYANVAGGVVAVAIARRIGLPVTPSILSEAYHCTTSLAEAIIDRYDVKEKKFVDTAWMF